MQAGQEQQGRGGSKLNGSMAFLSGIGLGAVFSPERRAGIDRSLSRMEPQPAPETGFCRTLWPCRADRSRCPVTVTGENDSGCQPSHKQACGATRSVKILPSGALPPPPARRQVKKQFGRRCQQFVPSETNNSRHPTKRSRPATPGGPDLLHRVAFHRGRRGQRCPPHFGSSRKRVAATLDPAGSADRLARGLALPRTRPSCPTHQALAPMKSPMIARMPRCTAAARQETPWRWPMCQAPVVRATEADPDTAAAERRIMPARAPCPPKTRTRQRLVANAPGTLCSLKLADCQHR